MRNSTPRSQSLIGMSSNAESSAASETADAMGRLRRRIRKAAENFVESHRDKARRAAGFHEAAAASKAPGGHTAEGKTNSNRCDSIYSTSSAAAAKRRTGNPLPSTRGVAADKFQFSSHAAAGLREIEEEIDRALALSAPSHRMKSTRGRVLSSPDQCGGEPARPPVIDTLSSELYIPVLSTRQVEPLVYAITGGNGYFGRRLAATLLRHGARKVHLLDVQNTRLPEGCSDELLKRVVCFRGDVRRQEDVDASIKGAHAVFHTASYGMSGKEQVAGALIREINVQGTQNVVNACRKFKVGRLVYTSTYNVVFGGFPPNPIINGGDDVPYLPLDQHCDLYSRTKSEAEMLVLRVNSPTLRTCALRSAGIYGEGEERHLPRIVGYIQAGLFCVNIGSPDSLVDFVYVDNLVHAHVLAIRALFPTRPCIGVSPLATESDEAEARDVEEVDGDDVELDHRGEGATSMMGSVAAIPASPARCVSGRAYFISDDQPQNNFEFFRPIVEGLGYKFPAIYVPYTIMFYVAFLIEILHRFIRPFYDFVPLLTRAEVNKTSITHYFSMEPARRDLGYTPVVSPTVAMDRTVRYLKMVYPQRPASSRWRPLFVSLFAALLLLIVVLSTSS